MILTRDRLASITSGYLRITEEHGYFCFHRYTQAQEDFYEDYDCSRYCLASSTAGVRFDFVTDSLGFSFDYELHSVGGNGGYAFDVLVDGKPFAHEGADRREIRRSAFTVDLPAGKKRLTVWLPYLKNVLVKNVRLDDGCFFEGVRYERTLLAIGDSITHGCSAVYPSLTYPARLATYFEWNVINQGIAGDKSRPGNLGNGIGFTPDYVTVLMGTNDWSGMDKARFDSQIPAYFRRLGELYPDSEIAVITPLWRGDRDQITAVGSFSYAAELIRESAQVCNHVTVFGGEDMIEHKKSLFVPDVLHPNDLGFGDFANHLYPALKSAFGID